jgi:hypothetical protein
VDAVGPRSAYSRSPGANRRYRDRECDFECDFDFDFECDFDFDFDFEVEPWSALIIAGANAAKTGLGMVFLLRETGACGKGFVYHLSDIRT